MKSMYPENDDAFTELTEETETPAYVLIQQNPDEDNPEYDLVGDLDIDEAIGMTVKGLFLMVADALGWWNDADDDEDDEDPLV